jgi:hypothetical protein
VKTSFRFALAAIIAIIAGLPLLPKASGQPSAVATSASSLTSIPLAPKTAAAQPIFKDDFASFDPSWGQPGPSANVTDGYFVLTPLRGKSVVAPNTKYRYRDFDASVDVTPTPAMHGVESAGLVFWGRDERNYYIATITNTGKVSVIEYKNGVPAVKAEKQGATPDLFAMQTVTITVAARRNHLEISAWGATLSLTNPTEPKGGGFIGFYGESSNHLVWIWRFSKLVVSAPSK